MLNGNFNDIKDKINSLEYCLKNDTGSSSVNSVFISSKLDLIKINILSDVSRIKKGQEIILSKSINNDQIIDNMKKINKTYVDLYIRVDSIQKSLKNDAYPLPQYVLDYLIDV